MARKCAEHVADIFVKFWALDCEFEAFGIDGLVVDVAYADVLIAVVIVELLAEICPVAGS